MNELIKLSSECITRARVTNHMSRCIKRLYSCDLMHAIWLTIFHLTIKLGIIGIATIITLLLIMFTNTAISTIMKTMIAMRHQQNHNNCQCQRLRQKIVEGPRWSLVVNWTSIAENNSYCSKQNLTSKNLIFIPTKIRV